MLDDPHAELTTATRQRYEGRVALEVIVGHERTVLHPISISSVDDC